MEQLVQRLFLQAGADDAQPPGEAGGTTAHIGSAGDVVKVQPLAVARVKDALGAQDDAVFDRVGEGGQDLLQLRLTVLARGLEAPARKHLIGMMVVGIASGMFMAGMFVTVGEIEPAERFSGVLNGQILTFLVGLPFFLATKPALTRTALIAILILGVFQLGISYVLYVQSTKYCPPLACNLLGALEPLLNPVWVFLFDGERPGLFALLGSVVVIVSITLWCIFGQERTQEA